MELIRGLKNLQPRHHGSVATIGNFDGVHLGHQAVIDQLADKARVLGLPSVVITFEPQPREYFTHGPIPPRLTRFREKIEALACYRVDRVLSLAFNRPLAQMPADEFVRRILVDGLGVKYLVVGDDFRFGNRRQGDFTFLQEAGRAFGFEVVNMPTFSIDGERVSSTRIRHALEAGNMELARRLLGRSYSMSGRVAHGEKLGRQLGFPTANIHIHRKAAPVQGIFVVEVDGLDDRPLKGVASIGTRPTVDGRRVILEVFLLDFDRQIYGEHLQVRFLHKLRDEEKFASLERLIEKIAEDVEQAQAWFRQVEPTGC